MFYCKAISNTSKWINKISINVEWLLMCQLNTINVAWKLSPMLFRTIFLNKNESLFLHFSNYKFWKICMRKSNQPFSLITRKNLALWSSMWATWYNQGRSLFAKSYPCFCCISKWNFEYQFWNYFILIVPRIKYIASQNVSY